MVGRPVRGGAVGAAVGGTSLLFALAACSTGSGGGNRDATAPAFLSATSSPSAPMSPSAMSAPSAPSSAAAAPVGPAAAATARMERALVSFADRPKPSTADIRAALVAAGFAPAAVEVTASRSPTGLDADAVEAAVRQDRDCVVAQLRAGTLSVIVLPVLADGRCLAGP